MKTLTILQLITALENNKFIVLRHMDNTIIGINCGIKNILIRKTESIPARETNYQSFYPCDFSTYLSLKSPFIATQKK